MYPDSDLVFALASLIAHTILMPVSHDRMSPRRNVPPGRVVLGPAVPPHYILAILLSVAVLLHQSYSASPPPNRKFQQRSYLSSRASFSSRGDFCIKRPKFPRVTMGVPSIEAEKAAASSLLMSVPIASLPGRLLLRVINHIHDLK